MLNLKTVLSRLGESTLTGWLGHSTVELLQALDLGTPSPSHLSRLLISRYTEVSILLNKKFRKKILGALKKDEAVCLCLALNIESKDPWIGLDEASFSTKSKSFATLLEAFGLSLPKDPEKDQRETIASQEIEPKYALFPHQVVASRKAIKKLLGNNGRVVLHMPTGAGKTRTAMNIISDLLRQVFPLDCVIVWLAHSEELCQQAADEFENAWTHLGNGDFPVHKHFGRSRVDDLSKVTKGFIVMSLGLAHQTSFNNDEAFFALARHTKLVIMDEAHQAIAETYQHVLNLLAPSNSVALLGLTATPGRSWLDVGEDIRLAEFFARQKVALEVEGYDNPIDYLRAEGYLAHVISEPIEYTGDYGQLPQQEITRMLTGLDISMKALEYISEDSVRNLRIIQRILEEEEAGEKIIVFACSVQHAETLANILELKGIKAEAVTGNTRPDVRANAIEQFKTGSELNVLISCDILTTGFDAPKASVAIITRPTKSLVLYSQMVGRVVRGTKAGGTASCKVITVVDEVFGFRDLGESFVFWDDLWE